MIVRGHCAFAWSVPVLITAAMLAIAFITLPKGGGAIRSTGEKFSANALTGAASLSVPQSFSPSRTAWGPSLALTDDSGLGNEPFGFGWRLSLVSIARKTGKRLPRYRDENGEAVALEPRMPTEPFTPLRDV